MLLDLDNEYEAYHMVLNELIFTILPFFSAARLCGCTTSRPRCTLAMAAVLSRACVFSWRASLTPTLSASGRDCALSSSTRRRTQLRSWTSSTSSWTSTPARTRPTLTESEFEISGTSWPRPAANSCYVSPLYLVVLRNLRAGANHTLSSLQLELRTVFRDESPFAKLAGKAVSSTSGGAAAYSFDATKSKRRERREEPVGEWKAEGDMLFKKWFGSGFPCVTCFRLYGVTCAHQETKGLCPRICKEAYADGKAPDFAAAAPPVPPPWTKQAVPRLASATEKPPTTEDAAAMTLRLPPPEDQPPEDPPSPDSPGYAPFRDVPPSDVPHPSVHPGGLDRGGGVHLAAARSLAPVDDEDEWDHCPAYAQGPIWLPPFMGSRPLANDAIDPPPDASRSGGVQH
ncbi:hypothetical protein CYMTET_48187 [Cymbomonas tetramitiformis]|uniref:Uncharacterized protein n=1 Tax=Cymbomonas tetramitiformis TaxID=36881 RepID=A0AAE0BSS3_9CHLO|nr:hypothetical protein CYMTET_48187 [Cymbomonas tetramitiformis]